MPNKPDDNSRFLKIVKKIKVAMDVGLIPSDRKGINGRE
jgi:hypothetical protein